MGSFQQSLDSRFPGATSRSEFVERSYKAIQPHGFNADNTIACVGVCRDELCRELVWAIRETWGEAFNFSGLGGMLSLGTAGFTAAHYHAPIVDGRERYLYVIMPHIGISEAGEFGVCKRVGRPGSSVACGALTGVLGELQSGGLDLELDHHNIEYSMLKQHLVPDIAPKLALMNASDIDITTLTLAMSDLISNELERMIALTVNVEKADYAVVTGVQIHKPHDGDMIWINKSYVCVDGQQESIQI